MVFCRIRYCFILSTFHIQTQPNFLTKSINNPLSLISKSIRQQSFKVIDTYNIRIVPITNKAWCYARN